LDLRRQHVSVLFDQKGSTVYTTLIDHLGTVRDLVNSSGQIVNHFIYDAFGYRTSENNPQGGAVPFLRCLCHLRGLNSNWLRRITRQRRHPATWS
jgi:YD repeat-containing protein